MSVIATWSPADAALHTLVPLGLAVAAGTALVIDLDREGARIGSGPTLADLVREGATRAQLEPSRRGPAFLSNGGIEPADAQELIAGLCERWPAVVLRCPPRLDRPVGSIAILPLLPDPHTLVAASPAVYQRCGFSPRHAPAGLVLPVPRRGTVEHLLGGRSPRRSDRWIRALQPLWSHGG